MGSFNILPGLLVYDCLIDLVVYDGHKCLIVSACVCLCAGSE